MWFFICLLFTALVFFGIIVASMIGIVVTIGFIINLVLLPFHIIIRIIKILFGLF
jgi:hypothetical protein